MKKKQTSKASESISDDMLPEYELDYRKARPNRFAAQINKDRPAVTLDPDIAEVFTTPESVNIVLRALITTMPKIVR
ncbi:MAG: hypothetical protein QME07_04310 [bacterium]|nr:hypothetical protein [bacterium]